MKHLTSEQLSAHLDGVLAGRAAEEAERHLAACEACREALAGLAAQDEALKPALMHDPGEAYFDSFAGRVGDRIRAAGLAGAQSRATGFDLGRLFSSPRAMAWAGGVAVLVVGAGLALMTTREVRPPDLRDGDLAERAQPATPEGAQQKSGAPSLGLTTPTVQTQDGNARSERDDKAHGGVASQEEISSGTEGSDEAFAPPPAGAKVDRLSKSSPAAGQASPSRAREVRPNAAGEDVPVRRVGQSQLAAPAPATTSGANEATSLVRKKQAAEPLKDAKRTGAVQSLDSGAAKTESTPGEYQFVPPPPTAATPAPAGERSSVATREHFRAAAPAEGEARLCGEVRDPAGRAVAGAQVTIADLGRTATSDARGAFCVDAPVGEHPLSVMAVGFTESRRTVRVSVSAAPVHVTLEAVSVLEDKRGLIPGRVPLPRATATPPGEPNDSYARLPDTLRSVVRAAQQLESSAAARRSARLFDSAAEGWERALRRLEGGPLELETRQHLAEARYRAWEAGPNTRRAAAAVEALTAYSLRAPAGAMRDRAIRWLDQVKR